MAHTEKTILKKLLDHYDQFGSIRERIQEELDEEEYERLRKQSRRKIDAIGKDLKELPTESSLGDLFRRYKLNKFQCVLLLSLLRQRLVTENPYMRGRELLAQLFDGSFDIIRGASLLEATGTLQTAGLIVPDLRSSGDAEDLLETPFKISDRVVRLVRGAFLSGSRPTFPKATAKAAAYRSNLSYVLDMRRLAQLYQKHASKIFQFDYWDDIGLGTAESVSALSQQITRFSKRIGDCLEKTAKADEFPLVRLANEMHLQEEELVILITLLFNELLEGSAFLDAVDLLKLISTSEEDLLRKRHFLGKHSAMIKNNLVAIEEMQNDKELTAEVYLPNWVNDRILGSETLRSIDADTRLDFHDYMKNLGSSDGFYDDLDAKE